jgi:glycine cleavage system H protein
MAVIRNCILPEELHYDVEHDLWARFEADGSVTMGLSDVGQSRAGRILIVTMRRRAGARVRRGEVLAVLESAKWLSPVRSLVSGEIIATNDEVVRRPVLVNERMYDEGWLARIAATVPAERDLWPTGADALARYEEKLRRPFQSVRGLEEDFWCVHCREGG